ncbi:MAG TPA: NADP-dependent oxidoreductase [Thermoanaerobaculia bacterium]|nr:NADP-dependent oxidoreductase [Thermoanaerobaculia bacterium]
MNRRITLASRPVGLPKVSDFHLIYAPRPALVGGQALVRSVYLALDPGTRGRMSEDYPYGKPLAIGEVISGDAVGLVVASEDPTLRAGDVVVGKLGWQEYTVTRGRELRRIDSGRAPISTALGVLGVPGLAAFFGLLSICDPHAGETAVVSGAAGAVGMIAAQIAKLRGCRTVGVAGSDAKIAWLRDALGIDAVINYRTVPDLGKSLEELCPDGIDVYFDNVGGAVTDAVVGRINSGARIAVCGQLSQYNLERPECGPRWLGQLVAKQAKMQGFLVSEHAEQFAVALEQLGDWLQAGKLRYRETVTLGIAGAPQAFIGMLDGRNQGTQLVQLTD